MKLITIKSQIKEVVKRFRRQYKDFNDNFVLKCSVGDKTVKQIYEELLKLDVNKATAFDIEKIMGNTSWTEPQTCDECNKKFDIVIQLEEEPDYESSTIIICKSCLEKALKLIQDNENSNK